MAVIEKFEDIEAWQEARKLTHEIYKLTSSGNFSKDFALKDQVRRAVISVMSNIAEGFERRGDKEFHHFLSIAKASAGELRSQLYVGRTLLEPGAVHNAFKPSNSRQPTHRGIHEIP